MLEEWRDIPSLLGFYQASNLGNVRSVDRMVTCSNNPNKKRLWKGKILSKNKAGRGYLSVSISVENKIHRDYVHRLVAEAFIMNPENLEQVNHIDGDRQNNLVSNLEWCDQSHNMKHANVLGLNNPPKKLSEVEVKKIKELLNQGIYQYKIAELFGVTQSQISNIKRGVSWSYV